MATRPVATATSLDVLNFVIVGERRSGSALVQGTVDAAAGVVCHANLLHENGAVRRACHERYFGESPSPEWYDADESPHQYLTGRVFDNPRQAERAVGVRLTYDAVGRFELYDLFQARCREGDFCLVHVLRNPVACFVSQRQAEKCRLWSRPFNADVSSFIPTPTPVDPQELTDFVRSWVSVRGKIEESCDDRLVVHYHELLFDFQKTMRRVFDFIELPEPLEPITPCTRRLRNRDMRRRVSGFDRLLSEVPSDVRAFMREDLI